MSEAERVAKELKLYSKNLTASIQRATSVTPSLLRHAAQLLEECAETHLGCAAHGDVTHGKEAEELRQGIEKIRQQWQAVNNELGWEIADELGDLLEKVDARDSLAHLEAKAKENTPWRCNDCGATSGSIDRCITCAGRT